MKLVAKEQWIADGRATPLPNDLSREFDEFLARLPWLGASLDWSRMPPSRRLDARSRELGWREDTRIGKHALVAVWYSLEEGGLVVPFEIGIAKLDELYWQSPGVRFVFGLDATDRGLHMLLPVLRGAI
jgi:hypothetical protein